MQKQTYEFDVDGHTVVVENSAKKNEYKSKVCAVCMRYLFFLVDILLSSMVFSVTVDAVLSIRYNYVGDTSIYVLPTAVVWGLVTSGFVFLAIGYVIVKVLPFDEVHP